MSGAASDRAKQRPLVIAPQACAVKLGDEVFLKGCDGKALCAAFGRPRAAAPRASVLREDILNSHAERRADPRERINYRPDQRAITQPGMRRDIDAVEQRAPRPGRAPAFAAMSRCRGSRTEPAGLTGTTWAVTRQSNR
jgi:hypothetical protein